MPATRFQTLASILLFVCLSASATGSVASGPALQATHAHLFDPKVRQRSLELVALTRAAPDAAEILGTLERTAQDAGLTPAQRDAVLYDYVRRLRAGESDSAPGEVMLWLSEYPAQAMRAHDESPTLLVPLFDVAAAAAGLEHQWQYEHARHNLLTEPERVRDHNLAVFLEDPAGPRAAGMRAALPDLPMAALEQLADLCRSDPELYRSALYPAVQLALGRLDLIADWIAISAAPAASEVLLDAGGKLAPEDAVVIYRAAMGHRDPAIQALAMAGITGQIADQPDGHAGWTDELLQWLDDPDLGAAAALQLARLVGPGLLAELEARAIELHPDRSLAIRRLESVGRLQQALSQPPEPRGVRP